MDGLEDYKRVLHDNEKKKLIVEDRKEALSHLKSSVGSELFRLKLQYSELKHSMQNEHLKYVLSCGLDSEDWYNGKPVTGDAPSKEEVNEINIIVSELKNQIKASKTETEEMCDEIELACDDFKSKLKTLAEIAKDYESKKQKLADNLEVSTALLDTGLENETEEIEARVSSIRDLNKQVTEKLEEVEENIMMLGTVLITGNELVHQINADVILHRGQKRVLEWCQVCNLFEAGKFRKILTLSHHEPEKCDSVLGMLMGQSGIQDKGVSVSTWCVSIAGPVDKTTLDSNLELSVKMHLTRQDNKIVLKSVEIDNAYLDASDIISRAVATNDLKSFLVDLQDLWVLHYPVVSEIESLRKKYAIDWEHENRTLTVIYGQNANIMCVLKVDDSYPSEPGAVTLHKVIGEGQHDLDDLKLSVESPTLTAWLEHLQRRLDPTRKQEDVDVDPLCSL